MTIQQPVLLCLDLGTSTGWAIRNEYGRIISGTAMFKPRRFEGGGMRYLRFERWLNETRNVSGKIDAVYFEEVRRHIGVDAAHAYGGFLAGLTAWCEHNTIPYEGVPVGTIKRFRFHCRSGTDPATAVLQWETGWGQNDSSNAHPASR